MKYVICLIYLFVATLSAITFENTYGGVRIDRGAFVSRCSDDGYIISGYTQSFGDISSKDLWLIKTDSEGNELWNKAFGGTANDEGICAFEAFDGGYAVLGQTESCIWLLKTDDLGNEQWSGIFSNEYGYYAKSLQQTDDGGYMILGNSQIDYGKYENRIIKTDSFGNLEWDKFFSDGRYKSMIKNSDGYYVLTGVKNQDMGDYYKAYISILEIDSLGTIQWEKYFTNNYWISVSGITQTTGGNYAVVGQVVYIEDYVTTTTNMVVIKYDSGGNPKWIKTFGGQKNEFGDSVCSTPDGGFIVAGSTTSEGNGGDDMWVLKLNEDSNIEWSNTFGGVSNDRAYSIISLSDNDYVIAGYTGSFGEGVDDVWLVRSDKTGTQIDDTSVPTISRLYQNYPNPFNPETVIEYYLADNAQVELSVFDITGREVDILVNTKESKGYHEIRFNAEKFSNGVYFYRLNVDSKSIGLKKMILLK